MQYIGKYLNEVKEIANKIDQKEIKKIVDLLVRIRNNKGRLFFLGVGGSAGNASHAVNDLRKITGIESYAPTDNVSELTARTNDDGWESVFVNWLRTSKINKKDCLFIFSVGGGNYEKNVSVNLINSIDLAKNVKAKVIGIVGRDGGYTAKRADACVIVPMVSINVTPHSEEYQAVIWHLLVSHPKLQKNKTKWESIRHAQGSIPRP